jgi:hypothetical protein
VESKGDDRKNWTLFGINVGKGDDPVEDGTQGELQASVFVDKDVLLLGQAHHGEKTV